MSVLLLLSSRRTQVTRNFFSNPALTTPATPTGDGTMDFSIATGDDTGLLALLEDI